MNTAFAFGCAEVWLVGSSKDEKKASLMSRQFRHAVEQQQILLVVFAKWKDVLEHLRNNPGIALVGVEIDKQSHVLNDRDATPPFLSQNRDLAILMGNEGQGILPNHIPACEGRLIRIPQYGAGTASFNVNIACSIALYHFHQWRHRAMTGQIG